MTRRVSQHALANALRILAIGRGPERGPAALAMDDAEDVHGDGRWKPRGEVDDLPHAHVLDFGEPLDRPAPAPAEEKRARAQDDGRQPGVDEDALVTTAIRGRRRRARTRAGAPRAAAEDELPATARRAGVACEPRPDPASPPSPAPTSTRGARRSRADRDPRRGRGGRPSGARRLRPRSEGARRERDPTAAAASSS
jgi:hypothetical protein